MKASSGPTERVAPFPSLSEAQFSAHHSPQLSFLLHPYPTGGASKPESHRGCAAHVHSLAGVSAIGCDAVSGVSGESREGERESDQAAGCRRAGGRHGGREQASSE